MSKIPAKQSWDITQNNPEMSTPPYWGHLYRVSSNKKDGRYSMEGTKKSYIKIVNVNIKRLRVLLINK